MKCVACLLVILVLIFLGIFVFTTPALAQLFIAPPTLPGAQVGVFYSVTLTWVGVTVAPNAPPHSWTLLSTPGPPPPGLTISPTGMVGVISGTPTAAGTYNFSVKVSNPGLIGAPSTTQIFTIIVSPPPITFVTTTLPQATEGVSYSATITVTGGTTPRTFSLVAGTLPSGLTLDATGHISGTPAKGTAGTHVFTIKVTDSSSPPLSAQKSFSLVVRKGFYDSTITIASTLAAGETSVYVDGRFIAKLRGGQTTRQTFRVGTSPTITVDPLVSHPTRVDVRYRVNIERIVVSEGSPDATFDYVPEYFINLKTDPPDIASLTGSGWYKEGSALKSTAQSVIEGAPGTQYRFSHWLLPTGERFKEVDLSVSVSAPGRVIATYDTYYYLSVTSAYGKTEGSDWYKAGTPAKWSVSPPEIPMSGFFGFLQGKLKPEIASGTEVMNAPKNINVVWRADYTLPVLFLTLLFLLLGFAGFLVYRHFYPPVPKPVAAPVSPPAPIPPTIVVVEGAPKPPLETTKEQLVEQFRQLLEKYEREIKGVVTTEALPETRLAPETPRLPPAKEAPLNCTYTTKNLLRTVVGNWRKIEERIIPPDERTTQKEIVIHTVWARDIYNEWEIVTCSLPQGHSGSHRFISKKAYSLQSTITAEKTYSPKQKITPPKPHFTDELPVVEVADDQIIATDLTSRSPRAISPDEIIFPDQPRQE